MKKIYRLIPADLSRQKVLDANSKAIQQIIFTGKIKATEANPREIIYYILEKSRETRLYERKNKSFVININGWI